MNPKIVQFKPCVKCLGQGELDKTNAIPKLRKVDTCDYCKGTGMVPDVTCRGCGRPAIEYNNSIMEFCGRKECWEKMVEEVDLSKRVVSRQSLVNVMRGHVWPQERSDGEMARRFNMSLAEYQEMVSKSWD